MRAEWQNSRFCKSASIPSNPSSPRSKGHRVICCLSFSWGPQKITFPVPVHSGFRGTDECSSFLLVVPPGYSDITRSLDKIKTSPWNLSFWLTVFPRLPLSHPKGLLISVAPCFVASLSTASTSPKPFILKQYLHLLPVILTQTSCSHCSFCLHWMLWVILCRKLTLKSG